MIHELPPGLEKSGETPVFTERTLPSKLTGPHNTKPGVWGKLVVLEGALDYIVLEPPSSRQRLRAGEHGIIAPSVLHRVEPVGKVTFLVAFYRRASVQAE